MLSSPFRTLFIATAALALGGCTITMGGQPAQQQQQPAAQPTAKPAAKRSLRLQAPGTTTSSAPQNTTTPPPTAIRVSSPIIFGNGTKGTFMGLAYVLPPDTQKLPDFSQLIPFATVYTDEFNVQSQNFSGGFPGALPQEEWFGIRYEGAFTLPKDGRWQFKVLSDDGAILYVDGQKIVENDGQHPARAVTGESGLKAGSHKLRLDYFQAKKGSVALVVTVAIDGKEQPLTGIVK